MFTKDNISGQNAEDSSSSVPNSQDAGPRQTARKSALAKSQDNNDIILRWTENYRWRMGVDDSGKHYAILQKIKKETLGWKTIKVFSLGDLSDNTKSLFQFLGNDGFFVQNKGQQNLILQTLSKATTEPSKLHVVTRSGWHGASYVIPTRVFSPKSSKEKFCIYLPDAPQDFIDKFRPSGTRKSWVEKIGRFCQGNTRLMFGVSLTLVQALLDLIAAELGGFQLYGESGQGKTTVLIVSGSVWGGKVGEALGYCLVWNHTDNNIEAQAALYSGTFLPIDETRITGKGAKNRAENFSSIYMRLSTGKGKGRLTEKDGVKTWKSIYLTSTNLTVDDILTAGGEVVDDAYRVRAIDIPLPQNGHGIFENLHGFASGEDLSDHLKRACSHHFGALIRAFLQRLVQERADDEAGLKERLERWRQRYIRRANKVIGSAPGMGRFHERFATVYLGARLAIKFGLLPWTWRELREAILTCERDHFRLRGEPAQKDGDCLAALKAYVSQNHSKMPNLDTIKSATKTDLDAAPGLLWKEAGELVVGLRHPTLRSILGSESTVKRVLDRLKQQGALTSERDGSHLKADQRQKTLKCGLEYRRYFYVFKLNSLK